LHLVTVVHGLREILCFERIHEQPYVRPDTVLFVDHPETDARELLLEVGEHVRD